MAENSIGNGNPTPKRPLRLSEFFEQLEEQNINTTNVLQSITYNEASRTWVIQMGNLLREDEAIQRIEERLNISQELRRLSESYRAQFPDLLRYFRNWEPHRKELIEKCKTYADDMDRNFSLVSTFRIMTSAADFLGSALQLQTSKSPWPAFAMEFAPALSLCSLFVELTGTNRMHSHVKKIAKKDRELFHQLKLWFQQTEELDRAVRNFFPYGIDEDLTRRINKNSSNSDEFSKLFMSIVASNAQKNTELFKDEEFLGKATSFASSEAGILWYHKAIANPVWKECFSSNLALEISRISTSLQNPALVGLDATNLVYRKVQTKMLLNAMTIYSAASDLWNDTKSENSEALREIAHQSSKEYEGMKQIVRLLTPIGEDAEL